MRILKRIIVFIGIVSLPLTLGCFTKINDIESNNEENETEKVNTFHYGYDWSDLIYAISEIESKHDTTAVSSNKRYYGHLQISMIMVKEANQICGTKRYTSNDRFNKEKSEEIFYLIQRKYNPKNNVEKAIRIWNDGPKYSIRKTNGYYRKVMKAYNRRLESNT